MVLFLFLLDNIRKKIYINYCTLSLLSSLFSLVWSFAEKKEKRRENPRNEILDANVRRSLSSVSQQLNFFFGAFQLSLPRITLSVSFTQVGGPLSLLCSFSLIPFLFFIANYYLFFFYYYYCLNSFTLLRSFWCLAFLFLFLKNYSFGKKI